MTDGLILNHKVMDLDIPASGNDKSSYFDSPQLKTTFSTDSRVQNMFDILLDDEMETEKRERVGIFCILKQKH